MELLLRLRHGNRQPTDVRVEIDPAQPATRLAAAIAEYLGISGLDVAPPLFIARTGEGIDEDLPVGEAGILTGDEIIVGPDERPPRPPPLPARGVSVDVLAGPDSGRSAVFDQGVYLVGQDSVCDLRLSDTNVARTHLRVEVGPDWTVTVSLHPDGAGGSDEVAVHLNGREMTGPAAVGNDDVVTVGVTRLAFRLFVPPEEEVRARLGGIDFHRTPYRAERVLPVEFERLGPIPSPVEPRRFQALSAVAPLVAGLALYAFTGQAQFLVLTLISPLVMVASWVEERRSGRRGRVQELARFDERLESRRRDVDAALEAERVARLRAAPDLADLARRAELLTIDLWPRSRGSDGFLSVRLGLGEVRTLIKAPLDSGGGDELRSRAAEALAHHATLRGVPVTCDLTEMGVLALHGNAAEVDEAVGAIAMQIACLHTPEDVVLAAAIGPDRALADWLKWLPHSRSASSPIGGTQVTTTPEGARRLLGDLGATATTRGGGPVGVGDPRWPWVVLFLDSDLEPDPALVSRLLDRCPGAGVSVVWLSTNGSRVPHQARAIVDCRGESAPARLWFTDPGRPEQEMELARLHPEVADRGARALAPVRDATAGSATSALPRSAPLLDVLRVERPDPRWVAENWLTRRPYGLAHPLGLGIDGPVTVDLVSDGPHALIGGTSGAGKSELLQSVVAALAATYPPSRVNFLFVDYKGGASSTVFRDLPHTVGCVTNLDGELALRALTSLRAELNRRMKLLEGRAKDLAEMLARHPEEAPPSLVIVVDEFATLVEEIPDFVAGMVDIAQRGRSLGIHLVLATQRPSGAVNDNILANTNLRVALRMLDPSDSSAVIGSQVAAEIPVPLSGRAYARLGPREVVAFQAAHASAPLAADRSEARVLVEAFPAEEQELASLAAATGRVGASGVTHLDALLDAVRVAARDLDLPLPRAPWCDVLPQHLTLAAVVEARPPGPASPGRSVTLGMVDDPEGQCQYPATVDLEEGGGLVVYGSGGSGRTTTLRTAAASAASDGGPEEVVIFGLDFASRSLRSITSLPHVAAVATGDDLEAVTRVIALLDAELDRRRQLLAEATAENLSAFLARGGDLARILVLVDGYPSLAAALTGGGYASPLDRWLDAFHRVVLHGRQVGIHTILTADRRASVPALLQAGLANRIVLRQADENAYADHGVGSIRARGLDLAPGRGLWQARQVVQIACVSERADAAAQAEELEAFGARVDSATDRPAIRTAPLPDLVDELSLETRSASQTTVALGVADLTLAPVNVDLAHSHLLVAGLARSGRSTAALLAGRQLAARGLDVWAVGRANSPLAREDVWVARAFGRGETVAATLEELATTLEASPGSASRVLVVDDLDEMEDPSFGSSWERLAKADNLRVIATVETRSYSGFSMNPLLNELRKARRVLFLQPDDPVELFQLSGVRPPIRPGTSMPPGRGVLVVDRVPTLIQVARTD